MARTPSKMLALGTPAPDFCLPDANGKISSRSQFIGKPMLVMFICNHCPFVIHVREELKKVGQDFSARVAIVAINSNDFTKFPDDHPSKMAAEGYSFPYLVDESQAVARAFNAACTPDFFLFDAGGHLAYRGQLDGARPGNEVPVTGEDLRRALESVIAGRPPSADQRASLGCNIKWKQP